ncbi:MAG TPA: hypothetical protein DCY89_06445 [Gammaproteobacteria bacterium]|nr:hypothetical protein [Gammaproteobacteria bacterium]
MPDTAGILRAVLVWLLLSVAGIAAGEALTRPLLLPMALLGDLLVPGFHWHMSFAVHEQALNVVVQATTEQVVVASPNSGLHPGVSVRAGATTAHLLLPTVIWLSVLAAARVDGWRQRLALMAGGLVASQILAALMGAILLAAKLELLLGQLAQQVNERRVENWVVQSMVFLETGGNVVLALIGAALCLGALETWRMRRRAPRAHQNGATGSAQSGSPSPASGG